MIVDVSLISFYIRPHFLDKPTIYLYKMKKLSFFTILFFLISFLPAIAQEQTEMAGSDKSINVFLDSQFLDQTYLREEFPQVNYVRTRESANVHLMGTMQPTGAGRQYEFFFIGLNEFAGKNDTLSYFSSGQSTQTEIREGYTKVIKMGLMRFFAAANQYLDIQINSPAGFQAATPERGGSVVENDPWDSWVFELDLNGNLGGQETSKSKSLSGSFDISRVTPEWRYEFVFSNRYSEDKFTYGDYSSTNVTKSRSFNTLIVNSLGDHMAVGLLGGLESSTRDNYDLNYTIAPAFEYNFYPYDMSSRRQLKLSYYVGLDGRNYIDSTIFDKTEEVLLYEKIALGYRSQEEWGFMSANVTYQHYLRDFNENNLDINMMFNIRIWKGLSWNVSGSYSIINDDINISKENVSQEDLLLGSRQLATSSQYSIRTGISFTFGSLYNNVVNPRLKNQMRSSGGFGGGGFGGGF